MFLVSLVESVTLGIIKKLSFDVGIAELRETYQQVRKEAGEQNVSVRLIDLAIALEHFANIPMQDVQEMKEFLKTNIIGYAVLRMLVREYLALFPCDYKMRQRIEQLLEFRPNDPTLQIDKIVRALPAKGS